MGRSLRNQLKTEVGAHEAFVVPSPKRHSIRDVTAEVVLELDYDGSLQDLAVIHHLLALKITKQDKMSPTSWDFTAWSTRLSRWSAWSVPMSWLHP